MSEGEVDLSQIRGDWKFHMDYLQNAIEQTLRRQADDWSKLGGNDEIDANIRRQHELWDTLKSAANEQGTIPTTDGRMESFIEACRDSRPMCDAVEEAGSSAAFEAFAESCRQARALCDDLEMMKTQRPDEH